MTSLQHYPLQVQNLDQIIIVVKVWSNDPHFTCKKKVNMKKYMKAQTSLVNDNSNLIEKT
jgi:hypothetical protein